MIYSPLEWETSWGMEVVNNLNLIIFDGILWLVGSLLYIAQALLLSQKTTKVIISLYQDEMRL